MEALRNPRTVLILAGVFAFLAAISAHRFLSGSGSTAATRGTYLVANQELRAGTVLQPEMLSTVEHDNATAPSGALRGQEQAVGRAVVRPLTPGEIVTADAVMDAHSALGPAYSLPPSMRAVTVSSDSVSGIAGFLKPGHRVDVLATFNRQQESSTRVVLQDIQVIAVGSETQPTGPGAADALKKGVAAGDRDVPVTLAVTPAEAERLVLADTRGKIRLALRPSVGGDFANGRGVTETEVSGLRDQRPGLALRPTGPTVVAQPVRPPVALPAPPRTTIWDFTAPKPQATRPKVVTPAAPRATAPKKTVQAKPAPKKEVHDVTVVRGTKVETIKVRDPETGSEPAPAGSGDESTR